MRIAQELCKNSTGLQLEVIALCSQFTLRKICFQLILSGVRAFLRSKRLYLVFMQCFGRFVFIDQLGSSWQIGNAHGLHGRIIYIFSPFILLPIHWKKPSLCIEFQSKASFSLREWNNLPLTYIWIIIPYNPYTSAGRQATTPRRSLVKS